MSLTQIKPAEKLQHSQGPHWDNPTCQSRTPTGDQVQLNLHFIQDTLHTCSFIVIDIIIIITYSCLLLFIVYSKVIFWSLHVLLH